MSIVRALAVLGAAGTGYMKGREMADQRKRQEEDDAWRRETRDRTRQDWMHEDEKRKRERELEQGLRTDAAPVTAAPASMRDATADDRDVGLPDGPSFGIKVGNQVVPDQAAADASMAEQNTIPAVMRRQGQRLQQAGKVPEADARFARAEALEKEGVLDALRGIRTAMPDPTALAAGTDVQFDIPGEVATKFNSVGKVKIPKDAVARGFMREMEDGTKIPDFRIISKDGSKVYVRSGAELEGAIGMTLEQQRRLAMDGTKAKRDADDKAADNKRLDAQQAEVARHNKAMERIAGARAAGGGAAPTPAVPWDDKASTFLRQRYTVSDPVTGGVTVDGQGMAFAKQIALAEAMRNGGDLDQALGRAFQIDAKIKAQAGDDPAKVAQGRQALLMQLMGGEPAAPAAPAAAAPAPAAAPARAAPAPAAPAPASIMQGLSFRERQERLAAQTKAMESDPDLLRLEAMRKELLRAGKATEANNAIAEMKRIRAERYGI
jgi:hypothetical protein